MRIQIKLALRYLAGRRLRTALTTLAVVFGVATFFGLNGMVPAMLDAFQRNLFATAGKVDLTVTSTSSGAFDVSVADKIVRVPGIAAETSSLRLPLSLPKGGPVGVVTIVGLDPTTAARVRSFPVDTGRFLTPDDRGAVVLGADLASKLGVSAGSSVPLPSVSGTRRFRVVGVIALPSTPGAEEVFMTLPDAQALFGEGPRVNTIEAAFQRGVDRTQVERSVQRSLGSGYQTGGIDSGSQLLASLKVSQVAINMFGLFALVMGAFIILNTFRTVVAERRHDIGMLRAIGASRATIRGMFLVESTIQGVVGTAVGMLLGWGFAFGIVASINPLYKSILNFEVPGPKFETGTIVAAVVLGIGFTVLGALAPALAAARLTPLEALRPQVADVEERSKHTKIEWAGWTVIVLSLAALFNSNVSVVMTASISFLVGLVLVSPALVTPLSRLFSGLIDLVFRTEGDLARSNMQRQPHRAATTASAIMISLAIVIGLLGVLSSIFTGFIGYVDKSLGSDFLVIPSGLILGGGHIGADPAFVARIGSTPGVGQVATLRYAQASSSGTALGVVGIDPAAYSKIASFEWSNGSSNADVAKLAKGRTVIANGIYAAQKGLKPGDHLTIDTPLGTETYTVVGVGSDYLNAKLSTVYTSQDNLANDFGVNNASLILANVATGSSLVETRRALDKVVSDFPQFTLYDSASFRAEQLKTFDSTKVLLYSLVGILALPTLLALLNTLAIGVLARTREIGMLRAVGSTRRQIGNMVLAESLLLATIGVAFGLAGGLVLGYALVAAMNGVGFVMPYIFPVAGIVTGVVVAYTFAWTAAWWPARQASRLDIVAALHYE